MSVFDSTTSQDNQGDNQGNTQDTTPENFLEQIVADKGEQWKDPAVLAKGYVHAQAEIARLKEIEAKAGEQDYAKTLLEKLQGQAPAPTAELPANNSSGSEPKEDTPPKAEDIESLILETLSKRDKETTAQKNLAQVEAQMEESFGTEAKATVAAKAKELGMSPERLQEIASESPTAFMNLMGAAPKKSDNSNPASKVNTTGFQTNSGERNSAYYSQLRRENKSLYLNPETQKQMMEDKLRLGSKF